MVRTTFRNVTIVAMAFVAAFEFGASAVVADNGPAKPAPARPRIEIAVLLDTSGSMSGLIAQAQTQLWKIVNEFESARRGGMRPDVFVALYEYGKSSLPASEGYMRMILPLTTDLDRVSEELFALRTNGGSEHCGQVIDLAVRELEWSRAHADIRAIFIAGNEPFTQGPVDFRDACRAAANAGITVSTIHCGGYELGVSTRWAEGAKLADGSYMCIDQDQKVADIPAPQDKKLVALSSELNITYIAYGSAKMRTEAAERQAAQDKNAETAAPAVAVGRAGTKASSLYKNSHWDLVDAVREDIVQLEELDDDQLPKAMRAMTPKERREFVESMAKRRAKIQYEIKKLNADRATFIADARKNQADTAGESTLDSAIVDAVRKQAEAKRFELE